mmetsp:Transcript_4391/g.6658  ORF Transcript_4391/g.6658 Transcript_4391/m.6658 type:complete len:207 (-) Transcript_4391:1170-1790(-)
MLHFAAPFILRAKILAAGLSSQTGPRSTGRGPLVIASLLTDGCARRSLRSCHAGIPVASASSCSSSSGSLFFFDLFPEFLLGHSSGFLYSRNPAVHPKIYRVLDHKPMTEVERSVVVRYRFHFFEEIVCVVHVVPLKLFTDRLEKLAKCFDEFWSHRLAPREQLGAVGDNFKGDHFANVEFSDQPNSSEDPLFALGFLHFLLLTHS